jgi:hypothetical protein
MKSINPSPHSTYYFVNKEWLGFSSVERVRLSKLQTKRTQLSASVHELGNAPTSFPVLQVQIRIRSML